MVEGGGEEPLPGGGGACGCHAGLFGVHAGGCVWHEFSCSEVDDSGGGVEFVEVGVEGGGGYCDGGLDFEESE